MSILTEATSAAYLCFLPPYARDIEKHWKYKETQRKAFTFRSPQLHLRPFLVDWLKNIAEKQKMSYRTIHLAIYILDMFMDRHSITKERLGFVALVCLMLAAKFEELDSKIPRISELNKFDGCRYSHGDFIKVEVMILTFLDFGLTQPTAAHFAEYYAMAVIMPQDLKSYTTTFRRLGEIACNIVTEFLDICMKEASMLHFYPSHIGAACILATRRRMNLVPHWTTILSHHTGYHEGSLNGLANFLLQKMREVHDEKKRFHSPDHGYSSGN